MRKDLEPEVGGADDAAAFDLSKAAEHSYREGKTVRITSEKRNGAVFYEETN